MTLSWEVANESISGVDRVESSDRVSVSSEVCWLQDRAHNLMACADFEWENRIVYSVHTRVSCILCGRYMAKGIKQKKQIYKAYIQTVLREWPAAPYSTGRAVLWLGQPRHA